MHEALADAVCIPLLPRNYWKRHNGKVEALYEDKWYAGVVDQQAAVIDGKYLVWWEEYVGTDGSVGCRGRARHHAPDAERCLVGNARRIQ